MTLIFWSSLSQSEMKFAVASIYRIYIKKVPKTEVQNLVNLFWPDNTKALIEMHAITGCDSVSTFSRKGKVCALKLMKSNQKHK